jgi:hypothetical protein
MFRQLVPGRARCHWYDLVLPAPVHEPMLAIWSRTPGRGQPAITGGALFTGGDGSTGPTELLTAVVLAL